MTNKNKKAAEANNPKLDPNPPTNTEKKLDQWVSGDDPMTGAQASYLKTLCEEAGDPEAFDQNLTKAEASKRIDELKEELGLE
jgi:hypothetical protein